MAGIKQAPAGHWWVVHERTGKILYNRCNGQATPRGAYKTKRAAIEAAKRTAEDVTGRRPSHVPELS